MSASEQLSPVADPALTDTKSHFKAYAARLAETLAGADWDALGTLARELHDCWCNGRQVFFCGNGGSAGNAMHIANDFIYGISKVFGSGLRAHALPANGSVVTCLANDEGYDQIFSYQLGVLANPGDVLIVFSGSGNSPNIVRALETANSMSMKTFAILGFSGGAAKETADVALHFAIDDMQISEDLQMILTHMIMQWLYQNRNSVPSARES
ncbi:MAG: SIS domain-containing protein [Pseudomonadota bacterium]